MKFHYLEDQGDFPRYKNDFYDLQIDFYKKNQSFKNYENEILLNNNNLFSFFDDVIDLNQYIKE